MILFKYIGFFLFFFWTVNLIASCKQFTNETKTKEIQAASLDRQHIHDSLPKPLGFINDFENLFLDSEIQTLDSLLQDFERKTTIQIAIITIDTIMTTKESLDSFTLKIANSWGVGQKNKNNGVVIGISRAYRTIRIENGYGIEKILTDAETKEIIDTFFIPGFRKAEYFQGTLNGLKSLMKILEERYK